MKDQTGGLGLKRALGLKDVVAIEVGSTIGAGIFALTPIAVGMCGPSVFIAYFLAAIPVSLLMLTLAGLSSALPTVGGSYRYPSRLLSPMWAFIGVWGFALGLVFGSFPLLAVTCAHYLQSLWPGIPENAFSVGVLTIFFIANLVGIGTAAAAQTAMVVVLILALLSYGIGGLPHLKPEYLHPFLPHGYRGLLAASALLTFAHLGSNAVIELGGEIKNPGRVMPLSLLIAIPLVTAVYILVGFTTVGVSPAADVVKTGDLTGAAAVFMKGPWFAFFVLGGAVLAITTSINATFMAATKSMLIIASDGLFPRPLAWVHPKFRTPWVFLTMIWALSTLSIIAGLPIETFANYAAIGGLIIFMPVMVSAMLLKKRYPVEYDRAPFKLEGALYWIAPVGGLLLSLMTVAMLLFDSTKRGFAELIFFAAWILVGAPVYFMLRSNLEKRAGKSIGEIMAEDKFTY